MGDSFFDQAVYPDEMREVRARREAVGQPTEHIEDRPAVSNGLVGLAISGGGVRSASFALGAVQVLARTGLLERVDYLSTVSGGGFLGSSISALLHNEVKGATRDDFPLAQPPGEPERPALAHVRSHADYLAPDGMIDKLRIPALLVGGIVVNVVISAPVLLLVAAGTDATHHWLSSRDDRQVAWWMLLGALAGFAAFVTLAATLPVVAQLAGRRMQWRARNLSTRSLGFTFFSGWTLLGLIPLLVATLVAVDWDPFNWLDKVGRAQEPLAEEVSTLEALMQAPPGVLFAGTALILGVGFLGYRLVTSYRELLKNIAFQAVGLLGPALIYLSYLATCAFAVGYGEDPEQNASLQELFAPQGGHYEPFHVLGVAGVASLIFVFTAYNVNLTSLHRFYRDRLSKAWLINHGGPEGRDDYPAHVDSIRLSDLRQPGSPAPYHLIQAAANTTEHDPRLHGKEADFFIFSKHWIGGRVTGWIPTRQMEQLDQYMDLGTALAISGAAAAPQMGTETLRPLALLMAMLNVRMGYWMPHPERSRDAGWLTRNRLRLGPGPRYMLREATGSASLDTPYVYVSDGGHIENLGVYGLIKRRCRLIIAIDGEEDPPVHCTSLMELLRYARMDTGIEIEIDVSKLHRGDDAFSEVNFAIGTIHYSDTEKGTLLYLKSSITGNEPQDLLDYRRRFPAFPHDSTADQFFDPARFEAYRALGHHVAKSALDTLGGDPSELDWLPTQSSSAH